MLLKLKFLILTFFGGLLFRWGKLLFLFDIPSSLGKKFNNQTCKNIQNSLFNIKLIVF